MAYAIVQSAEDKRIAETINRCAEKIAVNVVQRIEESLAGRMSDTTPGRGCRVPIWVYDWNYSDLVHAIRELVEPEGIVSSGDWDEPDGWELGWRRSQLKQRITKGWNATRPVLDQLFSGNWNGFKDSTVRRRIRVLHGRKIEDCDWEAFQDLFIQKRYPAATLWQGCWYTAEGLAVAQGKAGAALIAGRRNESNAVLAPYVGMTEQEGLSYLEWAWSQHDSSSDSWLEIAPDPLLDERLLNLGRMLLTSGSCLAWLLHQFCGCHEDPQFCWMVPDNDLWGRALRIERIWRQLPGYEGADLADI